MCAPGRGTWGETVKPDRPSPQILQHGSCFEQINRHILRRDSRQRQSACCLGETGKHSVKCLLSFTPFSSSSAGHSYKSTRTWMENCNRKKPLYLSREQFVVEDANCLINRFMDTNHNKNSIIKQQLYNYTITFIFMQNGDSKLPIDKCEGVFPAFTLCVLGQTPGDSLNTVWVKKIIN